MILWPRLPSARAQEMAHGLTGLAREELRSRKWTDASSRLFAPTGGIPVDDETLRQFRSSLDELAVKFGFPGDQGSKGKAAFDDAVIRFLADFPIAFGEAIRAETWAWLSTVLFPHIVHWRWADGSGQVNLERYAGPLVRNCFGRLWYQGLMLDRGKEQQNRWLFSDHFGADQATALLERPSLAANKNICLAIGTAWVALPLAERSEDLFRMTMKSLVVRAGVQRLDLLSDDDLSQLVSAAFAFNLKAARPTA